MYLIVRGLSVCTGSKTVRAQYTEFSKNKYHMEGT